jgi:hypothetical protein
VLVEALSVISAQPSDEAVFLGEFPNSELVKLHLALGNEGGRELKAG